MMKGRFSVITLFLLFLTISSSALYSQTIENGGTSVADRLHLEEIVPGTVTDSLLLGRLAVDKILLDSSLMGRLSHDAGLVNRLTQDSAMMGALTLDSLQLIGLIQDGVIRSVVLQGMDSALMGALKLTANGLDSVMNALDSAFRDYLEQNDSLVAARLSLIGEMPEDTGMTEDTVVLSDSLLITDAVPVQDSLPVTDIAQFSHRLNSVLWTLEAALMEPVMEKMTYTRLLELLDGHVQTGDSLAVAMALQVDKNKARKSQCYRVRIYFNNSRDARQMSEQVADSFAVRYPDMPVFRIYDNPYFKVTVGEFHSKSDAMRFMQAIRKEYPAAFVTKESFSTI